MPAVRPMRFARVDTRVSHDCRCGVHGTRHARPLNPTNATDGLNAPREDPSAFPPPPRRERSNLSLPRHAWEFARNSDENLDGNGNNASRYPHSFLSPLFVPPLLQRLYHFSAGSLPSFFSLSMPRVPFSRADTANMAD